MFRKSLSFGLMFMIGACVLAASVEAQYYYYEPGYYQPQTYMQPEMAYGGSMDSYSQGSDLQSLVHRATPARSSGQRIARPVSSIIQGDSPEDMPGIMMSHATEGTTPTPATDGATASAPVPDVNDGAIHILDIPGVEAQAHCCPDSTTGNCDKDLTRYATKQAAIDAGCDPECLVCVKEPFICTKTFMDCAEVVFFRCYQRTVPFNEKRCEDQRCVQEVGERTVKKLEPCTVKINFPCKKTIIDYREVWICIKCKDNC